MKTGGGGKVMLDARRKAGDTLKAMQERGELDRGKGGDRKSQSQPATVKLEDLGLTKTQSSRYQAEASVAEPVYQEWVERICKSPEGLLTASGLRNLGKHNGDIKPRMPKAAFLTFAKAMERLRTLHPRR